MIHKRNLEVWGALLEPHGIDWRALVKDNELDMRAARLLLLSKLAQEKAASAPKENP